jgi:hypothetical protein
MILLSELMMKKEQKLKTTTCIMNDALLNKSADTSLQKTGPYQNNL